MTIAAIVIVVALAVLGGLAGAAGPAGRTGFAVPARASDVVGLVGMLGALGLAVASDVAGNTSLFEAAAWLVGATVVLGGVVAVGSDLSGDDGH